MSPVTDKAQRVADKIRSAGGKVADAFHADEYVIINWEWVDDGRGGREETEVIVESGPCRLVDTTRQGDVRISGSVVVSSAPYQAHLPLNSVVTVDDLIRINNRDFKPTAPPRRGGQAAMFTVIDVQEAG